MPCVSEVHKRTLDSLKLVLQMVMRLQWVLEIELSSSLRVMSAQPLSHLSNPMQLSLI